MIKETKSVYQRITKNELCTKKSHQSLLSTKKKKCNILKRRNKKSSSDDRLHVLMVFQEYSLINT